MKVSENTLVKVPYTKSFSEMLVVENISGLILDSIKLYGVRKDDCVREPVDFYVRNITGRMAIYPCCGWYDKFILMAERITYAKIMEIKADDYLYKAQSESGDITLAMKG